jgi:hypothetical protein
MSEETRDGAGTGTSNPPQGAAKVTDEAPSLPAHPSTAEDPRVAAAAAEAPPPLSKNQLKKLAKGKVCLSDERTKRAFVVVVILVGTVSCLPR